MFYKSTNRNYDFRGFKTTRTYGSDIRNNVTSLKAADLEQANLMAHFYDFMKKTKPQDPEQKKLKSDVSNSVGAFIKGREVMYNAFRSGIFHRLENSPNQMLKILPIALAQVKASKNSESLLNEIRQIVYSLYRSKETTKNVYSNIINSIKV